MAKMYSEIQLDLEIKGYIAALEKAKQANSKLRADYEKKITAMNRKSDMLMSTLKKIGGVAGAAFGTAQIISFGREAMALAAKAEGVRAAFERLNEPGLLSNLREATRNTVTDLDLMTAAVRARNFNIALSQLPIFFQFASQRARETGESVDYLVSSIINGIGRRSALVLDNLGISATELQETLKTTPDYAEAVGLIIQRSMAKSGEYVSTTADSVDQLKTAMANLKVEAGDTFNSIFSKPLAEAARSLTEVAQGVQMLRREMDMGGANKDLAKLVKANVAASSGLLGGQLTGLFNRPRKLGKGEILIAAGEPIKLKEVAAVNAAIEEVDNTVKRTILDAEQMWKTLLKPMATAALPIEGISSGGSTLYADPAKLAQMQGAMMKFEESLENQYVVAGMLQQTFGDLFSAGIKGWDDFGRAAVNAIMQMLVQLAALAATYAVLSTIPGFAGFMEAVGGFSGWMRQGMGFTSGIMRSTASPVASSGSSVLKGRDIVLSGERSGSVIYKNT